MWEKIFIKVLPRIWKDAFLKIEKQDYFTKALKGLFKKEIFRKTWIPFCQAVIRWLEDGIKEVEDAMTWIE